MCNLGIAIAADATCLGLVVDDVVVCLSQAKYRETRQQMDVEIQGLDNQIDALDGSIKLEEEKSRLLREKADARESRGLNANPNANGANTGNANSGHGGASLEELSAKVIDVYNRSGFDNDASMSTLQMLTNIEAKLDEYFSIIETMPQVEPRRTRSHVSSRSVPRMPSPID